MVVARLLGLFVLAGLIAYEYAAARRGGAAVIRR
jgi:hypothetical protein